MSTRRNPSPRPTTDPAPLVGVGLGEVAYEAYRKAVDGVSVHGDPLPSWAVQTENNPHVAAAWCVAAQAVITATIERKD